MLKNSFSSQGLTGSSRRSGNNLPSSAAAAAGPRLGNAPGPGAESTSTTSVASDILLHDSVAPLGRTYSSVSLASLGSVADLVNNVWEDTQCVKLVRGQHVFVLDSKLSASEAVRELREHELLSAPVYDDEHSMFLGMFDIADLISILLQQAKDLAHKNNPEATFNLQLPVKSIVNASGRNPFLAIPESAKLHKALDALIDGTYRVAIVSNDTESHPSSHDITGILTQKRLLQSIAQSKFRGVGVNINITLRELLLECKQPVCISGKNDTVLDAMELMHRHGLSEIGVTDETGAVVEALSTRDVMQLLESERRSPLLQHANEAVAQLRGGGGDNVNSTSGSLSKSSSRRSLGLKQKSARNVLARSTSRTSGIESKRHQNSARVRASASSRNLLTGTSSSSKSALRKSPSAHIKSVSFSDNNANRIQQRERMSKSLNQHSAFFKDIESYLHGNASKPRPVRKGMYAKFQDTVADAARQLVRTKRHCIWVVDADRKPVATVTLTDILKAFEHWQC
jgi:CBS domain-containing protein